MSKGPPFEIRDLALRYGFPSHIQVPHLPLSYPAAHSFRKAAQPRLMWSFTKSSFGMGRTWWTCGDFNRFHWFHRKIITNWRLQSRTGEILGPVCFSQLGNPVVTHGTSNEAIWGRKQSWNSPAIFTFAVDRAQRSQGQFFHQNLGPPF